RRWIMVNVQVGIDQRPCVRMGISRMGNKSILPRWNARIKRRIVVPGIFEREQFMLANLHFPQSRPASASGINKPQIVPYQFQVHAMPPELGDKAILSDYCPQCN